jgi:hypothetical protein
MAQVVPEVVFFDKQDVGEMKTPDENYGSGFIQSTEYRHHGAY